jgi:hypothetical protein
MVMPMDLGSSQGWWPRSLPANHKSYLNKKQYKKPQHENYYPPLWLEPLDKAVHGDVDCVRLAVAPGGPLAVLNPSGGGEVSALGTVETYRGRTRETLAKGSSSPVLNPEW